MKTIPITTLKKFSSCAGACLAILLGWSTQAAPNPVPGTPSAEIGTWQGWTFWLGWDATFSESYEPLSETYAWVLYFSPEAIYLALQPSQALYSGVDVNLGFDYFYGFLLAPNGAETISRDYVSGLWGVAFSTGAGLLDAPIGPLSGFSLGTTAAQTFYRRANTQSMVPGFQRSIGVSASVSLLPVSLPFSVSLDRNWSPAFQDPGFSGFWPIAVWNLEPEPQANPLAQIESGLNALRQNPAPLHTTTAVLASQLIQVIRGIQGEPEVLDYLGDPYGAGAMSRAIQETEDWLQTSETDNLPERLKPLFTFAELLSLMQPIQAVTQLGFESGYRIGAENNPNNDTVYVDGIITNYCVVGEACPIQVHADELSAAVPGTQPADFEGAWIGFDVPVEYFTAYADAGGREWIQIENGVAEYVITQSLTIPQIMGVVYDDDSSDPPLNGGADVELKRRLLIFVDRKDGNQNRIPDYWETKFHLPPDAHPAADSDGDGLTNEQEFLADTDPLNADAFCRLQFAVPGQWQEGIVLPQSSRDRRYRFDYCPAITPGESPWQSLWEGQGTGGALQLQPTEFLDRTSGFFRLSLYVP